ncbi:hypothetical protein [Paraflavitalea speifideaquila]|uniref:hypothetical protein n=1 Tax=Paraflavitalea speifideaquila TaxID=3076558 RepID=UPI0028E96000|nr:hypothetical protein [Paraflavitalea speifideiaquila]
MVVTIYNLTDVFFVGHYLGTAQIAGVGVVGAVIFLLSSLIGHWCGRLIGHRPGIGRTQ